MSTADPATATDLERRADDVRVTDPHRILGLLESLRTHRILLSVRVDGDRTPYNSALLKLEPEAGAVFLDELTPATGHLRVQVGSTLRATGLLNGVPTHFTTSVLEIGNQGRIAYYRAEVPRTVDYRQRRAFYRAHAGRAMNLSVRLQTADEREVSGWLLDVSAGGFAARLPLDAPVRPFDIVNVTRLELPEQAWMSCRAEVRYCLEEFAERATRAGFRFLGLGLSEQRVLTRAILALERENIRRQAP